MPNRNFQFQFNNIEIRAAKKGTSQMETKQWNHLFIDFLQWFLEGVTETLIHAHFTDHWSNTHISSLFHSLECVQSSIYRILTTFYAYCLRPFHSIHTDPILGYSTYDHHIHTFASIHTDRPAFKYKHTHGNRFLSSFYPLTTPLTVLQFEITSHTFSYFKREFN